MRPKTLAALVTTMFLAAGCGFESHSSVGPSPTNGGSGGSGNATGSMVGVWSSLNAEIATPRSCANFQWKVTSQTSNSMSGTFSADCADYVTVSGNASGQMTSSTTVAITVTGTANLPGAPGCNFTLNGNGTIEDNATTLRVPYTGTTCLGPVQGTEVLHKSAAPPPDPTPAPAPPPTPSPAPNPNHVGPGPLSADRARQVVFATANEFPNLTAPKATMDEAVASAQELLRRMIWHLQLAGFQAGRQRNPSGVLSNDKLTVFADGAWHAYDVFGDLGAPGQPAHVQFIEVTPPNYVADPGIPD